MLQDSSKPASILPDSEIIPKKKKVKGLIEPQVPAKKQVPVGWRCNFKGTLHSAPGDCDHPEFGGAWIYDDNAPSSELSADQMVDEALETAARFKSDGKKPPCTTFVQTVFANLGITMDLADQQQIQIATYKLDQFDKANNVRPSEMRGSAGFLIDRGLAREVSVEDAQRGDIIQYFYEDPEEETGYGGHTAIVAEALPGGRLRLIDSNRKRGPSTDNDPRISRMLVPTVARLK